MGAKRRAVLVQNVSPVNWETATECQVATFGPVRYRNVSCPEERLTGFQLGNDAEATASGWAEQPRAASGDPALSPQNPIPIQSALRFPAE